jgi:hypothetical protein
MLKTAGDQQIRGLASLIADTQVRVRAQHRSANERDDSKLSVTIAGKRPSARSFFACTKPLWQPGNSTTVTVDEQHATYLPPLEEVES